MRVLHAYEREAAGFGMQLMHQVGVTTLDQWYSDFVATDWRYVERYYSLTGRRVSSVAARSSHPLRFRTFGTTKSRCGSPSERRYGFFVTARSLASTPVSNAVTMRVASAAGVPPVKIW